MKLYHELAEYYYSIEDKHRDIFEDVRLVRSLLSSPKSCSILDLGCGTGEHCDLLSREGFRLVGLDNSAEMLTVARLRFPKAAQFVREDILHFDFYQEFDMAMSLFGSFNYVIDDEDVDRVFWNTWRALKNRGIGLFEIWNAVPVLKIKKKDLSPVSTTHYKDLTIDRERGFTFLNNPGKTIVEVNYIYTISGRDQERRIVRDRHVMRAYMKEEIAGFVQSNGFEVVGVYSNAMMEPYSELSNRMIFHFIKK